MIRDPGARRERLFELDDSSHDYLPGWAWLVIGGTLGMTLVGAVVRLLLS